MTGSSLRCLRVRSNSEYLTQIVWHVETVDISLFYLLSLKQGNNYIHKLTRVERTEYESGDQQRSEAECKFGMETQPQNAFVSGWPKKVFCLT